MKELQPEKDYFFCRKGMKHIGPLDRRTLRRYLAAGLIDAQTLISLNGDGQMLPLGASAAAGEITWAVRSWQRNFSLPVYLLWLIFMPLASAGFASYGIYSTHQSFLVLIFAMILAQLGMSYWLWRTWNTLLADKHPMTALLFALPMAIPVLNIFWVWIGYMLLPKYWKRYKNKLGIHKYLPYWIYYLATVFFYLTAAGVLLLVFLKKTDNILLIYSVGTIGWIWFGLTMLSLFIADAIVSKIIQSKLSNLAFGALRFCADIDYGILHKTVLAVALSNRNRTRLLALFVLIASWLTGGWFWLHSLEKTLTSCRHDYWKMAKDCINCTPENHLKHIRKLNQSNLVKTNTERQGK